jgi:threonine synthase
VPDHASPAIVARLQDLGADVTPCARAAPGGGDPSYAAFRDAVSNGALPFSCQGNENGLVIEGATTLVHEMLDQARDGTGAGQARPLRARGNNTSRRGRACSADTSRRGRACSALDRVFIQVGGGALASACVQALSAAVRAGRLPAMPRIHAVQTCGGHPLTRAYDRLAGRIEQPAPERIDKAMRYARAHRSEFMWPWEVEPHSVAGGILDDETYDWAAIVEAMARTGGFPVVVQEAMLEDANALARETTGINVDYTGSSGLAGLLALTGSPDRPRPTERVVVLFTGVRR